LGAHSTGVRLKWPRHKFSTPHPLGHQVKSAAGRIAPQPPHKRMHVGRGSTTCEARARAGRAALPPTADMSVGNLDRRDVPSAAVAELTSSLVRTQVSTQRPLCLGVRRMKTALCERLGIELPIVQAPMGGAVGPALASAVSNAGGLGMLVLWRAARPQTYRSIKTPLATHGRTIYRVIPRPSRSTYGSLLRGEDRTFAKSTGSSETRPTANQSCRRKTLPRVRRSSTSAQMTVRLIGCQAWRETACVD
jgi:Nitronate monooxygenase